jgi:chromosome segregation ATPase
MGSFIGEEHMDIGKAKQEAEDLVVRLREVVSTLRQAAPIPARETKREQLKAVSDSIRQLEHKHVPVPDDLQRLKGKLESAIDKVEKHQVVLYFLREQLSQVLAEIGTLGHKS